MKMTPMNMRAVGPVWLHELFRPMLLLEGAIIALPILLERLVLALRLLRPLVLPL